MTTLSLILLLAATNVDLDIVSVPLSNQVTLAFTPVANGQVKREGTVSRIRIQIDKIALPSSFGPMFNTYVVWAISPEGLMDNLGELEIKGVKAQFDATTPLTQFAILITAEPHYMVDRPSSAVVYRNQVKETDFRRKTVKIEIGPYDYSQLKPMPTTGVHSTVAQARIAFQIAQAAGADFSAPAEFRAAQVLLGSMEELVNRATPLDILWPTAHEAIRSAQKAAMVARSRK